MKISLALLALLYFWDGELGSEAGWKKVKADLRVYSYLVGCSFAYIYRFSQWEVGCSILC